MTEYRWTAMNGEYPVAHHEARFMAERIAREKGLRVTHFIKRERAYPFRTVQTVMARRTANSHSESQR